MAKVWQALDEVLGRQAFDCITKPKLRELADVDDPRRDQRWAMIRRLKELGFSDTIEYPSVQDFFIESLPHVQLASLSSSREPYVRTMTTASIFSGRQPASIQAPFAFFLFCLPRRLRYP